MKLVTRVAATATAVLSISALSMPLASAAEATSNPGNDRNRGKITVCVNGDRGAGVRVAGDFEQISRRDCETFRGLRAGRDYRVRAFEPRGCDIRNDRKFVRASRDGRTVFFNVRCFNNDRFDGHEGRGGRR